MTWPFITSPHLPPQAVVLRVAVCARRIIGALTAAAAAPLIARNLRREIFGWLMVCPPRSSEFDIGAQADDALEEQHRRQRERDRDHRRGGDRAVEVIA